MSMAIASKKMPWPPPRAAEKTTTSKSCAWESRTGGRRASMHISTTQPLSPLPRREAVPPPTFPIFATSAVLNRRQPPHLAFFSRLQPLELCLYYQLHRLALFMYCNQCSTTFCMIYLHMDIS